MLEELQSKIDLYQEQIDNLEQSGHFTDKEIEIKSIPLKAHLELLKTIKQLRIFSEVTNTAANIMNGFLEAAEKKENIPAYEKYGMTQESYETGKKNHEMYFAAEFFMPVINPEILTPNQKEA